MPDNVIPTLYALLQYRGFPIGVKTPYELIDVFYNRGFYTSTLVISEQSIRYWLDTFTNDIWDGLNAYHTEQLRRRHETDHK